MDTPAEGSAGEAPTRAPVRRSVTIALPRLPRSVGIAALVVALGLALLGQWRRAEGLAFEAEERRAIAAAASALGTALMTYDFNHLDRAERAVLRVSTKQFAAKYREAFGSGLKPLITRLQARATASAGAVYVTEIKRGSARAIVVLDSEVESSAGLRRLVDSYLEMGLRREGGRWKVNDVTAVAAAGENVIPPGSPEPAPPEALPTPPDPNAPAPPDPGPPPGPAPGGR